jgi:hypothetical protein
MVSLALAIVVALTSLAAYRVGTRRLGLRPTDLRHAGARAIESAGFTVLFLLANVAVGTIAILSIRHLTGYFITAYLISDITLVVLSVLQALCFQWWRMRGN